MSAEEKGYRKLEIFRRSKELALQVHKMTLSLPRYEQHEEGSQIRRSSKSIVNNIVEGYCLRKNKNEFLQHLNRSYGSCEETIQHLELLFSTNSLTDKTLYENLRSEYEILSKQIFRFIQTVGDEHAQPFYVREEKSEYTVHPLSFDSNPQSPIPNQLFLRACYRQPTPRTPIWIMRQAGRYLPEYRAIRAKTDFLTMYKTPELAAEVTIQPVDIIGVDAAIIFSDILVVPEAMGMELIVEEGKGGPRFPKPVRTKEEIEKLFIPDPNEKLKFVMDAIRLTRKNLNGRVPLIGFSGSPWTLAAYMIEGQGSKDFRYAKEMLYNSPQMLHDLLGKLAHAVADYLNAQIEAGAQAVQIFDTWGGILTQDAFQEFSLQYIEQVIAGVKRDVVPVIVFCKDCGHSLQKIAGSGCDVVGLDWTIDIGDARRMVGGKVALQGNLDPTVLYAKPEVIKSEVKKILEKFGKGSGHIFNLGHGITPDVPVKHVKELVKCVKELSVIFH